MNDYPYFCWYAKDAETDVNWRLMTFAQRGFFMTCLNLAWINNGIPSDLNDLAILVGCSREVVDEMWTRVGKCFVVSEDGSMLLNSRQQKDLQQLIEKSEKARQSGKLGGRGNKKATAKRTLSKKKADEKRTLSEGLARTRDRADAGVSASAVSGSEDFDFESRFDEIWQLYPTRGRTRRPLCQQIFIEKIQVSAEPYAQYDLIRQPLGPEGNWTKSEQWEKKGFVMAMSDYLANERWLETPPRNGHTPVDDKIARMMARAEQRDREEAEELARKAK